MFPVRIQGQLCNAMAAQIAAVSKRRLLKPASELSVEEMRGIEHAVAIQLQLPDVL